MRFYFWIYYHLQELFYLLDEKDEDAPDGMVTVKSLVVELMAGGVSPEHTKYVSHFHLPGKRFGYG